MKTIVSMMLLVFVLGASPAAQTLAELLQKGIYSEETLRNRDEAERIYRQILAAPAVPRSTSEEAQRRLARLLLAHPPAPIGNAGFATLSRQRGTVTQGRYQHVSSGIAFGIPAGWSAGQTFPSSDNGDMVTLTDVTTGRAINVWMIKEEAPAARLAEDVAGQPAFKVMQRHSGYGIPGMSDSTTYSIAAETVRPVIINGRHAIIAIGAYAGFPLERVISGERHPAPELMREYMTWINGEHARAFFFARVTDADLSQLRPVFDAVVNSTVFP